MLVTYGYEFVALKRFDVFKYNFVAIIFCHNTSLAGPGTLAHGQKVPDVPRKVLLFLDSEETLLNPDENENEKTICKI